MIEALQTHSAMSPWVALHSAFIWCPRHRAAAYSLQALPGACHTDHHELRGGTERTVPFTRRWIQPGSVRISLRKHQCSELILISVIGVIVLIFIYLMYKEMFLVSFDEEYANVMNINKWIHFMFIIVVALVISASMRIVGILLVSALMTLPVASAMRVTSSFRQLMTSFAMQSGRFQYVHKSDMR